MADPTPALVPVSPLAAVWSPGDHGRVGSDGPGVHFAERRDLAIVSLAGRADAGGDLDAAVASGLGLTLPGANESAAGDDLTMLWVGLDRWLVLAPGRDGPALMRRLAEALGDSAALADQSHGESVLDMSGPRVRAVLAKATPVDVDAAAFPVGRVVSTVMNHTSVQLWRTADSQYRVIVHRGFARDLFEFLTTMAREVGYRIPST